MSLNAALIGFGSVARHGHLPWYLNNPSIELSAVVEPTARGREVARALLPRVPVFPSLGALLDAQKVTFVDITAQPSAHRELVLEATAAGAHVVCEKPFVTSWQALQDIEATRREDGPIIAACHNWYFAPAIRRSLEVVAAGIVGEPEAVAFSARRPQPARGADHWKPTWRQSASEGGGIIGDLGYHGFYLVSRIFGRAPISVRTHAVQMVGDGEAAERAASVDLDYGEGKRAELTLSWLSNVRDTVLQVEGTRGRVVVNGNTLRLSSVRSHDTEECFEALTADSWHAAWTGATLDWFLAAMQSGDRDACWKDIRWSVAVLDAAYVSVRSGVAVATSSSVTYLV